MKIALLAVAFLTAQAAGQSTTSEAKPKPTAKEPPPKPTPEAIAAAKEMLVAIVANKNGDLDRAYAKLKIETDTDLRSNALLLAGMTILDLSSQARDLPSACVGDVNKQLRAGIWPDLPESCRDKKK